MLDARIASSLKKIIQNSHIKKNLEEQKAQEENRFLRYMIYDILRVTLIQFLILNGMKFCYP